MTYERYRCPRCGKVWWLPEEIVTPINIMFTDKSCPGCGVECVKEATE
jgi:hypothetical protein